MKEINYIGEISGSNKPMIVTVPINTDTDIKKGTPIFYNKQTVSTLEDEGSTLIGIVAEDYYCEGTELIPGGTGEIKVIVSDDAVYECDGAVFQIAGASENVLYLITDSMPSQEALADLTCSKLVLKHKVGYANPDAEGTAYTVFNSFHDGDMLVLECDVAASNSDDEYIFLPPD